MDAQNYNKKTVNKFLIFVILYKEKMRTDKAQLKVEIEDGHEAP